MLVRNLRSLHHFTSRSTAKSTCNFRQNKRCIAHRAMSTGLANITIEPTPNPRSLRFAIDMLLRVPVHSEVIPNTNLETSGSINSTRASASNDSEQYDLDNTTQTITTPAGQCVSSNSSQFILSEETAAQSASKKSQQPNTSEATQTTATTTQPVSKKYKQRIASNPNQTTTTPVTHDIQPSSNRNNATKTKPQLITMAPLCGNRGSRWVTRRDIQAVETSAASSGSASTKVLLSQGAKDSAMQIGRHVLAVDAAIESVLVGPDFVAVNMKDRDDWEEESLKESVLAAVQEAIDGRFEAILYQLQSELLDRENSELRGIHKDAEISEDQHDVVERIQEIIDEQVRPNLQADGGDVVFTSFDPVTGVVQLRLIGACSTCPSSTGTMHFAIRNLLTYLVDEVKDVVQVWDEEQEDEEGEIVKGTRGSKFAF